MTQCETLDDVRLNLSETDYGDALADMNTLIPTGLQKAAVEKVRFGCSFCSPRRFRQGGGGRQFAHIVSASGDPGIGGEGVCLSRETFTFVRTMTLTKACMASGASNSLRGGG